MIKYLISLAFLGLSSIVFAQKSGIEFEKDLSLEQVMAKAKAENKYIFMDLFATWCLPCRIMDKTVYDSKKVGQFINSRFISLKIQMDKSPVDDQFVQEWYNDAELIRKSYEVKAYPTFLFFSPDGKLVHKDSGQEDEDGFIQIATLAIDHSKRYSLELDRYKKNKLDRDEIKSLIELSKIVGEKETARQVANDYINNYLFNDPSNFIFSKEDLLLMGEFLDGNKNKALDLFLTHPQEVNLVLGEYEAQYAVMKFIDKNELPQVNKWKIVSPDWNSIENTVLNKYGNLGQEVLLGKKMIYYLDNQDWRNFENYYVKYFEKAYKHPLFLINNLSWYIFEHTKDQKILLFAVDLMKYSLETWDQNNFQAYDTYANLLYKTGSINKALEWQQNAVKLSNYDSGLVNTLKKMKSGISTWEN